MATEPCDYPNLLVVVGASAGGLDPLRQFFTELPPTLPATIIVATHRSPDSHDNVLKEILSRQTHLRFLEPVDGEALRCTTVYVGRSNERITTSGHDLVVERILEARLRLSRIDDLFFSAARSAGANAIGVILSGMLADGVKGLRAIHQAGGRCFAQDPAEALFSSMPSTAIREVPIDYCGSARQIARLLVRIAEERSRT